MEKFRVKRKNGQYVQLSRQAAEAAVQFQGATIDDPEYKPLNKVNLNPVKSKQVEIPDDILSNDLEKKPDIFEEKEAENSQPVEIEEKKEPAKRGPKKKELKTE